LAVFEGATLSFLEFPFVSDKDAGRVSCLECCVVEDTSEMLSSK
jgi:hypothetical protein